MSSSISNSSPLWKTALTVALGLLCVEAVLRWKETSLSIDVHHIRSLPEISQEMRSLPPSQQTILFLGNSLTRHGVLPDVLTRELQKEGSPPLSVKAIYPDASSIKEWYFLYHRYISEKGVTPTWLVLVTGERHLQDDRLDPVRLGAFFASNRDFIGLLSHGLPSMEEKMALLFSRFSVAFANRERIAPRLFTLVLPHYQDALRQMNEEGVLRGAGSLPKKNASSYTLLENFLSEMNNAGTKPLIACVPLPKQYSLSPELLAVAKRHGAKVIDLQDPEAFPLSMFPDHYHLGPSGGVLLSERLAERFRPIIAETE